MTADVYGAGEADSLLGRALAGVPRESYSLVGAIGHDFYEGERDGPRGYPALHRPAAARARRATATTCWPQPSAASSAAAPTPSTCCCSTTPTAPASRARRSGTRWRRPARRGLTRLLGVAPGPANGFTLDLIGCLERFGDRIDWAMVILNPLEPWPGELALDAAARNGVKVITRVVDYGGLFHDDVLPGHEFARGDHRDVPARGLGRGGPRADGAHAPDRRAPRPDDAPAGLRLEPRARRRWSASRPTLIQEAGRAAPRPIEAKRDELADAARAEPAERRGGGRAARHRRQHGLHGAEGRLAGARGRGAARPLAAAAPAPGGGAQRWGIPVEAALAARLSSALQRSRPAVSSGSIRSRQSA